MRNLNACCLISGVYILLLLLIYCYLFPGMWLEDFTTTSPNTSNVSSLSSFREELVLENTHLYLEQADQEETEKGGEYKTMQKQNKDFTSKLSAEEQKPLQEMQGTQETGKPKTLIQNNASNLTYRQRRLQIDQQLRNAINIHHERNFIKPQNETCIKRFPTCILIGVYKCGTQELIDFLNLHPHIKTYPSTLKSYEMPYFISKYKLGDEWLQSQMPCTYSNQMTIMKNAGYFHDAVVPERIKIFNESIKLILMVREPISRAVSNYMNRLDQHLEFPNSKKFLQYAQKNFSQFVLNSRGDVAETDSFVRHSVYDKPMELWLKYFSLNQFLIMDNEEIKNDPISALNKVERFLGIEHFITDDMFILNEDKGFYCVQTNITDTRMACYSTNRGHKKQNAISEMALLKLRDYFYSKHGKNKNFFKIIGRSFDW